VSQLTPEEDAFGAALADHHAGRTGPELTLVVDDGFETPAMPPAAFFLPPSAWPADERELLTPAPSGPVLDLGAGAGRHSLWFQERGDEVTAVDVSPGAVSVCRARGVRDARLGDLTDPPADRPWAAVLLLCGNLGQAGGWDETRALLARLARLCAPGAVLLADSVDPTALTDDHSLVHRARNEAAGRHPGRTRLRLRYGEIETPWWDLLNLRVTDIAPLVDGTGWAVERHRIAGPDHYVAFRRQ
jgi:SAM-dependent methyltransferase